jgi:hypothetical protein
VSGWWWDGRAKALHLDWVGGVCEQWMRSKYSEEVVVVVDTGRRAVVVVWYRANTTDQRCWAAPRCKTNGRRLDYVLVNAKIT